MHPKCKGSNQQIVQISSPNSLKMKNLDRVATFAPKNRKFKRLFWTVDGLRSLGNFNSPYFFHTPQNFSLPRIPCSREIFTISFFRGSLKFPPPRDSKVGEISVRPIFCDPSEISPPQGTLSRLPRFSSLLVSRVQYCAVWC